MSSGVDGLIEAILKGDGQTAATTAVTPPIIKLAQLEAAQERLAALAKQAEEDFATIAAWMRAHGFPPEAGCELYLPKSMLQPGADLRTVNLGLPRFVAFHPHVPSPVLIWGGRQKWLG